MKPTPTPTMRYLIALTVCTLILVWVSRGHAGEKWTDADVKRELFAIGMNVADFGTTVIFRSQNKGIYEANPIFGRDVSDAELFTVTVATSALHIWIADIIPAKYRPYWQYSFGGIKLLVVGHNLGVGFGWAF